MRTCWVFSVAMLLLAAAPVTASPPQEPGADRPGEPEGQEGAAPVEPDPAEPAAGLDESLIDEYPLTWLKEANPRTAAQQEKLDALALFAAARMKEQDQDFAGALRLYQRALRHDPDSLSILEQVITLDIQLGRADEAGRYALKAVELDPSNALLLRRLALQLTDQGDLRGAVKLYQKALTLESGDDPKSASRLLLLMEMGRLSFLSEDFAGAAEAFAKVFPVLTEGAAGLPDEVRQVLLNEPGKTYELFGEAFLRAGKTAEAEAAFEKAGEAAPDEPLLAFQRARVREAAGDHAQALEKLQVYFDAHADSRGSEPYTLLAKVLDALGRKDDLLVRLEKLHAADEKNAPLGYFLAEQYRQAGQLDKAEPLLAALAKESPDATGYSGLAQIYRQSGRTELLFGVLAAVAGQSGGFDPLGDEAQTILADRPLVDKLLEAARALQSGGPDGLDYGGRVAAALLAMETKQYEVAAEFFNAAIAVKEDNKGELLLTWGVSLLVDDRYAEAAAVFRRGVDEHVLPSGNPAFHYYLAGALEMAGQTEEALSTAREAVALADESPRLHGRLAWVLYHAKRYDEAADAYVKIIEKFENEKATKESRQTLREARLVLSNICVLQNKIAQAEEWLEQVLDAYPEDVSASNDLGYLWADQGKNLDQALKMLQFAVGAEPDNGAYRDSLGWVLYRLGRFDEALAELKKAAEVETPDGVVLDHLGDAYSQLGQGDAAREAWQRALKSLDPQQEADRIKKIEEKLKGKE